MVGGLTSDMGVVTEVLVRTTHAQPMVVPGGIKNTTRPTYHKSFPLALMALEIITRQVKKRRFVAFDLEWVPGKMQLRLIGVFDPERGYRHYSTVEQFFRNEFTHKNRGKWFYAHFGGRFDASFFVSYLVSRRIEARFMFSGSMAVMIKVKIDGMSFTIIDSGRLYPSSLKDIGKAIGMAKGGPEDEGLKEDFFANASIWELMKYNRQDCEILWQAVHEFQKRIRDIGSDLQVTLASTAMHLFRRKYLKQDIKTDAWVNARSREAYFASRVEVFQRECVDGKMYDINSSFPYSMTFPCPGAIENIRMRTKHSLILPENPDSLYIADVEFIVPEQHLTPVPFRHEDGRVFFPVGRWRQWLTSIDIQELLRTGGRIVDCFSSIHFAPFTDLAAYATDLYARRKAASDPTDKQVFKLLLNSLYGKFAESEEKQAVVVNPNFDDIQKLDPQNEIMPGVWLSPEVATVAHVHVPISAHITAIARRTLYGHLEASDDIYYCDTDSIVTTSSLPTSDDLGGLKLEATGSGLFLQPKVYRFGEKVRAKGFSLGKANPRGRFDALVQGGEVVVQQHMSIKQMFRKGVLEPREFEVRKRLQKFKPKRFTFEDGRTRPWHIRELTSQE